jgi:hypothetical protein
MTHFNPLQFIRFWLAVFMAGLVLSGVTAFPLRTEINWLDSLVHSGPLQAVVASAGLTGWIDQVAVALNATGASYPFLAYGTDWLGFAHLAIAAAFIGPFVDPVRNKWVIAFGLITCAGVIPLALIAGQIRGIPLVWRLIDCGFGVFGSIPLLLCRRSIQMLEHLYIPVDLTTGKPDMMSKP